MAYHVDPYPRLGLPVVISESWYYPCGFIAPPLHEQVENLAFVVNRAPQPELLARDRHGHLIEMPPRGWPRASTPKFSGEQRPNFKTHRRTVS